METPAFNIPVLRTLPDVMEFLRTSGLAHLDRLAAEQLQSGKLSHEEIEIMLDAYISTRHQFIEMIGTIETVLKGGGQ